MVESVAENGNNTITRRRIGFLVPVGLYAVGVVIFFRAQIFSHFDLIFGDRGDARFVAFIHEHVYRWLQGRSELLSPPFFFNQPKTLGYSDGFLLNEIIYAPLRILGAEPLLALSLVALFLSPIAFVFVYLFLRRLNVLSPVAAICAFLFTFANNLYLKSGHLQHFVVYYIPLIVYCGLLAISDLHRRPVRAVVLGAFAASLYGFLFSTGYYMAWFFGLGLLISVPFGVCISWPVVQSWWKEGPSRVVSLGAVAAASAFAALSIFVIIYAPVMALGFKRSFGDYLNYAPTPSDIVNVGIDNLVWSKLIRSLHLIRDERLSYSEVSIALTPVVQCLVWASGILALRPHFWPDTTLGRTNRALVITSATVCVLFFVLTVKTHNVSLFRVLYAVVPGANAIRVGYRGMVVGNLFAVTAIGLTMSKLLRTALQQSRTFVRIMGLGAIAVLLSIAALEQINLAPATHLSRSFERAHLAQVGEPPRECRTFYVAAQPGREPYEVQIDAMMIALDRHLPTINGYSGLNPPGWNFYDTNDANYEQLAMRWAVVRGIADLCRINVEKGAWTEVHPGREWSCVRGGCVHRISFVRSPEFEINLAQSGNGALFTDDHWAGPEPWGEWTTAKRAALSFSVGAPRDLSVALSMRGLLSAGAPKQSAWIDANGCHVGKVNFELDHPSPQTSSGNIPANCIDTDGKVVLHIDTDRLRSPQEIGINGDTRRLGIGVDRIVIRGTKAVQR